MDPQAAKLPMPPEDVGVLVRLYRDAMGWTQETLAELSGLTVRTIQRVEAGQPSSLDTRRAIARGFEIPDLDVFAKPMPFPTEEELKERKAAFDRDHMVLDLQEVDGRQLVAMLMGGRRFGAITPGSTAELPRQADDAFAPIVDFLRECLDVVDDASSVQMLSYGDALDELIVALRATKHCLCAAQRSTGITSKTWTDPTPMPIDITYVVAAPVERRPSKLVVPRKIGHVSL
jgi:transcriptional regulator with XRE-family HTH domain